MVYLFNKSNIFIITTRPTLTDKYVQGNNPTVGRITETADTNLPHTLLQTIRPCAKSWLVMPLTDNERARH